MPCSMRDDAFFELIDKIFLVRDDDHRRAEMVDALEQAHDLQRARGVQVAVGSSAMMVLGLLMSARAMATRCCSPPESSLG